jgi:hypothetical protein
MEKKAAEGKVIQENGRYFVKVGTVKEELVAEAVGGAEALKALAGQSVEVLYSEPQSFIVGLRLKGRPPILCYLPVPWIRRAPVHEHEAETAATFLLRRPTCYIPADWMVKGVEEQVRLNMAKELLDQGIINKEVYGKIVAK